MEIVPSPQRFPGEAHVRRLPSLRRPHAHRQVPRRPVVRVGPGTRLVALRERAAKATSDRVDEVVMGCVLQAGLGQNPARQAALKAGLPDSIAAYTVNKVCGSGLKAVMLAAQSIRAGDAELVLAGGMESMSRAPYLLFGAARLETRRSESGRCHDPRRSLVRCEDWHMGEAAEHIAAKCGVTRAEQDRFAAQSQHRAAEAWDRGAFAAEVVPVTAGSGPKAKVVSHDEGLRPETTAETLLKLKPAFREGGTVTAGNASTLSDGAAALLVGSARAAERLEATPLRASSPTRPAAWRPRTFSSPRCWRCGGCWKRRSGRRATWTCMS